MVQKTHISALVRSSVNDAVSMVSRGRDIGPTSPMDPSSWPSWNARSHGHLHEGRPLYIQTDGPPLPHQNKEEKYPGRTGSCFYRKSLKKRLGYKLLHLAILDISLANEEKQLETVGRTERARKNVCSANSFCNNSFCMQQKRAPFPPIINNVLREKIKAVTVDLK